MKKKYLIMFAICLGIHSIFAQTGNYGGDVLFETPEAKLKSKNTFTPTGNIKNIRVIVHYLLKDDGSGNFNEEDDGLEPANDFSGYEYAEYLIDIMNNHMSNPCEMHLQPFGNIPVYDCEFRYKLVGTFFWRSTTNYNAGLDALCNAYAKNTDDCLNIFLTHDINGTGGYVRYLGDYAIHSSMHYNHYMNAIENDNMWYNDFTQKLINHEVGHCFNLHHTLMTGGGTCTNNYNDYCDDTPTIQDMLNLGEPDPCCWNASYCSNNLMDYNADKCALTPDQLSRVHEHLNNSKYYMWINHFNISSIDIGNVTASNTYIAETIDVSKNIQTTINDSIDIFINSSEVIIHPGFEIKKGGQLFIMTNESN